MEQKVKEIESGKWKQKAEKRRNGMDKSRRHQLYVICPYMSSSSIPLQLSSKVTRCVFRQRKFNKALEADTFEDWMAVLITPSFVLHSSLSLLNSWFATYDQGKGKGTVQTLINYITSVQKYFFSVIIQSLMLRSYLTSL